MKYNKERNTLIKHLFNQFIAKSLSPPIAIYIHGCSWDVYEMSSIYENQSSYRTRYTEKIGRKKKEIDVIIEGIKRG